MCFYGVYWNDNKKNTAHTYYTSTSKSGGGQKSLQPFVSGLYVQTSKNFENDEH